MKVSTMRRIDSWVGVPVCTLLTWVRHGIDACRRVVGRGAPPVESLLFIKLAEQGATVLAGPAIQRAIEKVGRDHVYFLVFQENRFILDVMGLIPEENVVTISTDGLARSLLGTLSAVWQLRTISPGAAVDFEFFARSSAIFAYLSGAPVRIGLHAQGDGAPYRGDLMTHRLKYNPKIHTADTFLGMVDAVETTAAAQVDASGSDGDPTFNPGREELARVETTLKTQAASADYAPLVLLNGNASDLLPLRRWPRDRYIEVAESLIAASDKIHVAFTGAPNEAAAAEAMVAEINSPRCFSMAGKTSLADLLVLYCLADLLITNDSGPAHFASLTPIQVITLFGPETPALFGARTPRAHNVWKNLHCRPCVSAYNNRVTNCNDNQCMKQITVDEVLDLAWQILGETGAPPIDRADTSAPTLEPAA
jgi:ADP-heptose:LPS heptosyltransferase